MAVIFANATGSGQAVGCDACHEVLEPGARNDPSGPWNAAEALSAAESRGWFVTRDVQVCPGFHTYEALLPLERRGVLAADGAR